MDNEQLNGQFPSQNNVTCWIRSLFLVFCFTACVTPLSCVSVLFPRVHVRLQQPLILLGLSEGHVWLSPQHHQFMLHTCADVPRWSETISWYRQKERDTCWWVLLKVLNREDDGCEGEQRDGQTDGAGVGWGKPRCECARYSNTSTKWCSERKGSVPTQYCKPWCVGDWHNTDWADTPQWHFDKSSLSAGRQAVSISLSLLHTHIHLHSWCCGCVWRGGTVRFWSLMARRCEWSTHMHTLYDRSPHYSHVYHCMCPSAQCAPFLHAS